MRAFLLALGVSAYGAIAHRAPPGCCLGDNPVMSTAPSTTGTPSVRHLVFAHANGYLPGSYARFLAALGSAISPGQIVAPALVTPPGLQASKRWPTMMEQLDATVSAYDAKILIGHSMGGYLCLQVAARRPGVQAVVLIDSPLPTGWRSALLSFAKFTRLSYRTGPAPIAARRRDRWPSIEHARRHFAGKPFVQRWAPGVLDDFLAHAVVPDGPEEVMLAVPRAVERDIYAHIAHEHAARALRMLRLQGTPVGFVAGECSPEVRLAGFRQNARLFAPHWRTLPTGHLVPLDAPDRCAETVFDLLGRLLKGEARVARCKGNAE